MIPGSNDWSPDLGPEVGLQGRGTTQWLFRQEVEGSVEWLEGYIKRPREVGNILGFFSLSDWRAAMQITSAAKYFTCMLYKAK